ncbi:MAG: secretin N-terminal domain-containing protein [Pseudomonadota bacterium]|nr:secretin N-terminal domain-containing protein [Pseudomonadota bacterium]
MNVAHSLRHVICIVLGGIVFGAASAGPADPIEVIPLQNRMADELVPIIRPLLAPDDALTASRNQLIVRTDPATLAQIREVLRQLDMPPRNLLISVRTVDRREAFARGASISGRIGTENARVTIGNPGDRALEVRAKDRSRQAASDHVAGVRVLEGQSAQISTGHSVPVVRASAPGGVVYRGGYRDAGSGYTVLPRVSGETVTLQINPSSTGAVTGPYGSFETRQLDTVVSGRLGEWLTLGGIDDTASVTTSGIASGSRRTSTSDAFVQVRVEVVD